MILCEDFLHVLFSETLKGTPTVVTEGSMAEAVKGGGKAWEKTEVHADLRSGTARNSKIKLSEMSFKNNLPKIMMEWSAFPTVYATARKTFPLHYYIRPSRNDRPILRTVSGRDRKMRYHAPHPSIISTHAVLCV